MKKRIDVLLVARYYLIKLADAILNPLRDIPVPDFNDQYDSTMLQ